MPPCHITNLPPELLELIFRKLPFDNVAKVRAVCHHFNTIASSVLNSEFSRLRMNMLHRFHSIKAQMPRRESARRKHPLARESDIIETLHMRLTLLHMTFGKHIERKHCCFFAGEVLDEVYRILNYVKTTPSLNRAYKVTDELFDLSTMAMEYFKEHIEPSLPEITYLATDFLDYTPTITSSPNTRVSLLEESVACASNVASKLPVLESVSSSRTPMSDSVVKKFRKLRDNVKKNKDQITTLEKELKLTKRKIFLQQKQISDFKSLSVDYNRKFLSMSRKLTSVMQELNHFRAEFQYWRSKSPAAPCVCGSTTPDPEAKNLNCGFPGINSRNTVAEFTINLKPVDFNSLPSSSSFVPTDRRLPQSSTTSTMCKKRDSPDDMDFKMCIKIGKRKSEFKGSTELKSRKVHLPSPTFLPQLTVSEEDMSNSEQDLSFHPVDGKLHASYYGVEQEHSSESD